MVEPRRPPTANSGLAKAAKVELSSSASGQQSDDWVPDEEEELESEQPGTPASDGDEQGEQQPAGKEAGSAESSADGGAFVAQQLAPFFQSRGAEFVVSAWRRAGRPRGPPGAQRRLIACDALPQPRECA